MNGNGMRYFYIAKKIDELKELSDSYRNHEVTGSIIGYIGDPENPVITLLPSVPNQGNDITADWLLKTLNEMEERLGVELPTPATILIHFGGQGPDQCSKLTKAMYAAARQTDKLERYYFFAISRENRYPGEFWNDDKLTLPAKCEQKTDEQVIDELREKVMNDEEPLAHLKGIEIICCELLLCEDDTVNTRLSGETGWKYWQDSLWQKNDKTAFSKIEENIIENGPIQLKNFCNALRKPAEDEKFDLSQYKNRLQSIIELIREQIRQVEQ